MSLALVVLVIFLANAVACPICLQSVVLILLFVHFTNSVKWLSDYVFSYDSSVQLHKQSCAPLLVSLLPFLKSLYVVSGYVVAMLQNLIEL